MNLCIVGNISRDTVCYNSRKEETFWGGAGLNVAVAAAAQSGLMPKLVSIIGKEDAKLLDDLSKYINVSYVLISHGKTCQFEMMYSEEGMLQKIKCDFGVSERLNEHIKTLSFDEFSNTHIHICCRHPLRPEPLLSRLISSYIPFSLDIISSSAKRHISAILPYLSAATCLFVNREEYEILASLYEPRRLQKIVITAASQPVIVLEKGLVSAEVPCTEREFRDVTGAGDVFAGAYLSQTLKGVDTIDCVKAGIELAQLSLQFLGVWHFLIRRINQRSL
jgi:sugar/nucleoside kinase (ribokinase family)